MNQFILCDAMGNAYADLFGYLLIRAVCWALSFVFLILMVVWRKRKTAFRVYFILSAIFITATVYLWINDHDSQTAEREKRQGFYDNFGYAPPVTVKKINSSYLPHPSNGQLVEFPVDSLRSSQQNWHPSNGQLVAFTYDPSVFNTILSTAYDKRLDTAYINTTQYKDIVARLKGGAPNYPDWFELPNSNTPKIYFTKMYIEVDYINDYNALDRSYDFTYASKEFYLWVDTRKEMVYLEVLNIFRDSLQSEALLFAIASDSSLNTLDARSVKVGTQEWMIKNLNVDRFANGDPIPEAKTNDAWISAGENHQPAWCYYNNDPTKGLTYGKLYNWYAVNDPRGLAPKGWHVPSDSEWDILMKHLSGNGVNTDKVKIERMDTNDEDMQEVVSEAFPDGSNIGAILKSTYGWMENGNGNNKSGMAALPGGERGYAGGFHGPGRLGAWWSSSESAPTEIYSASDGTIAIENNTELAPSLLANTEGVVLNYSAWLQNGGKIRGLSVRCIKD